MCNSSVVVGGVTLDGIVDIVVLGRLLLAVVLIVRVCVRCCWCVCWCLSLKLVTVSDMVKKNAALSLWALGELKSAVSCVRQSYVPGSCCCQCLFGLPFTSDDVLEVFRLGR